jgi:hypothetical protein
MSVLGLPYDIDTKVCNSITIINLISRGGMDVLENIKVNPKASSRISVNQVEASH